MYSVVDYVSEDNSLKHFELEMVGMLFFMADDLSLKCE